jgi:Transposase DDE domain
VDGFDLELLNRLPLAESAWTLFRYVAHDAVLEEIFEQNRGRAYSSHLTFSTLVDLISNALLVHRGSGRQSFAKGRENGSLAVTDQAAYGKLRRMPVAVSETVLSEAAARLTAVAPVQHARSLPACFAGYQVVTIDGKKVKKLAKRLKPLRGVSGSLLGGKVLVAIDGRSGLATAMSSALDGEANDAPLVPTLVPQVRSRVAGPRLWLADRQFSDLSIPWLLSEQGDGFVIRHCLKMKFHRDCSREVRESRDGENRLIREEWGWVGSAKDKRRMYVRRITLERPNEEPILVLTNLLDGDRFPAEAVLALYRERWHIERVFQQVTEVFQLQALIGSSPQAAILQAALCFVLYNMIQVIRGYVAQAHEVSPESVSEELLFRDVQKQMTCWTELGTTPLPQRVGETPTEPDATRRRLTELLSGVWSNRWRKSPPKKNWKPTAQTRSVRGGHSSAWKLLEQARSAKLQSLGAGG